MVLCHSPAKYVCRINRTKSADLPEEADDICNMLLAMLKFIYQAILMLTLSNTRPSFLVLLVKEAKEKEIAVSPKSK